MAAFFTDEMRRNAYPLYDQIREAGVLHVPPPFNAWLVLGYAGVKQIRFRRE